MPQLGPDTTFFSYARSDSDFVLTLARDLRQAGADVWLDQLDIEAGSRWDLSVGEALKNSKKMLVILSPDSVSSNNVMDEVSFALEAGKTVIPILFKPCDIPFRLKRVQHADFTKNYDDALKNLVQALKLGKITPAPSEKEDSERTSEERQKSEKAEEEKLKAQAEARRQEEERKSNIKAEADRLEEEKKLKEQADLLKKYNESISITHAHIIKKNKNKTLIIVGVAIVFLVFVIWIVNAVINYEEPISTGDESQTQDVAIAIGDYYAGGIIFYLDASGQHGLIAAQYDAALSDQSTAIPWSNEGLYEIGETYPDIGAGLQNTNRILYYLGAGNNAAQACADYIWDGYDDWVLPSIDELQQLYYYQNMIGGFSAEGYWSSTEFSSDFAYYQLFSDGTVGSDYKSYTARVRAVRAF